MAKFVEHVECSECGSSDANATYDDGSTYCFSCGAWAAASLPWDGPKISRDVETTEKVIKVPHDIDTNYSQAALEWVKQYGLDASDLLRHQVKWSDYRQQLIFLYENAFKRGLGLLHARCFVPGATKYYNEGDRNSVVPIYGSIQKDLIIVEDAVSAMRVSRHCSAMPLLGSSISLPKTTNIKRMGIERVVLWLDRDKLPEARKICQIFGFIGVGGKTIHTDLDPKCYTDEEIKRYLS